MLSNLLPNTALFIDYSNIFYAKYTVGWFFDVERLLEQCRNYENISFVGLYGAYDPKNLDQFNWKEYMEKNFSDPKFLIYFKPLEEHGSKNKGNVDTEMGFDLAEYKNKYDHVVLMSGDGDFAHPIRKIVTGWKTVLVCSTRWHISGLANLSKELDPQCRFLDFNTQHTESIGLRNIVKNTKKGLAIDPALQTFLKTAPKSDIQDFFDFVECRENHVTYTKKTAKFFSVLNKNKSPVYKYVARWQPEERTLLKHYLLQILSP